MASEQLAIAGLSVLVADAMPSVGRKFLMAGKSGLNITKAEPEADFIKVYPALMADAIAAFGPKEVMAWTTELGQPMFTGSTGRVFPKAMKASPWLCAWVARLGGMGVTFRTRWHWDGWDSGALVFNTPDGPVNILPKVTVLALGGASWARLGSDGKWAGHLLPDVTPFEPANMGFAVSWSDHMAPHLGKPVKAVALTAGAQTTRGEIVLSKRGIEGGGIYMVSRAMREGDQLHIDLMPDWSLARVRQALAKPRGKSSLTNHLRKVLRFDGVQMALLSEFGRPFPDDLAGLIKALPVRHGGPRPIDEAISTGGGVRFSALTKDLMLKSHPGVFCAGEMLDWEAPTGGYLITGCLATGLMAGRAAATYGR